MAKITLKDPSTGFGTTDTLTENNTTIEAAFDNTISRDGTSPNAMNADFDLNNNKLLNVATPSADADGANKAYVDSVTQISGAMNKTAGHWDAEGLRIQDVAEPDSADDAATKGYVDGAVAGGGNVPGPSDPADDNKVLVASGGLFSWVALTVAAHLTSLPSWAQAFLQDTTIAAARTELGAAGLADANTFTKSQTWKVGSDVASDATLNVTGDGNFFDVTGTTAITSIDSKGVGTLIVLRFDSAGLTLTHHTTDLSLPGAADIVTQAGDIGTFYEYASGDWRCISYTRADGTPVGGSGSTAWSTGDVKTTYKATADTGWVMMDDGTIGNASSGATTRANADTEALFELLWDNISDTYATVSGGRGATAQLDYDANKTITLPSVLGRAMGVAGAGSGLTSRALGEDLGSEDAILVSHQHTTSTSAAGGSAGGVTASRTQSDAADSVSSIEGESATGKNMQPTSFLNVMIKL